MSAFLNDVPVKLHVTKPLAAGHNQFEVESDYHRVPGNWDDVYVSFSGFFGSYGPDLFAAAPELAIALADLVKWHGKRDAGDNLLPAHEQTREISLGMRLLERIEAAKANRP